MKLFLIAALCVAISCGHAQGKALLQVDGPKTMRTAANGTSLVAPGKDTLFFCERTLNGTAFPMTLIKPATSWVDGVTIDISKIPTVNGSVMPYKPEFKMTKTATHRHLKGNGIPNHPIGVYPIPEGEEAYNIYSVLPAQDYPNAAAIPVEPYDLDVTLPLFPKVNAKPTCIMDLMLGVATQTGAAWHVEYAVDNYMQAVDPNAALPTDLCWGHPYQTEYHYHGYSWKCFPNQGVEGQHSPLFGYAMDGFGIFGPRSEGGVLIRNADMDECHGHTHKIEWEGKIVEMYHYHLNTEYPYSVGCFRGTPVMMMENSPSPSEPSPEPAPSPIVPSSPSPKPCKRIAPASERKTRYVGPHLTKLFVVSRYDGCMAACKKNSSCWSFTYHLTTRECQLFEKKHTELISQERVNYKSGYLECLEL